MTRRATVIVGTALVIAIGIFWVAGIYLGPAQSGPVVLTTAGSRWEPILFKPINRAAELSKLPYLRRVNLVGGDVEVRIWRGFGLQLLEGVVLRRINHQWTALHIKTDSSMEAENVQVLELYSPRSGWPKFWQSLVDHNLLTLSDPSEIDCPLGLDGLGYVVEINQNKIYRTYHIQLNGHDSCRESKQMEVIGSIIGTEFDSGREKCKNSEWFPCENLLHQQRKETGTPSAPK